MTDQSDIIAFLSDPNSYPHRPEAVERIDTHGAMVFLADDQAFKIKRAVRFSYMDFSTLALREAACRRELELNQPTAPQIYFGLVPITRTPTGASAFGANGEVVEWAIHMRRFAQADVLCEHCLRGPLAPQLVKALACAVHAFHAQAATMTNHDSAQQMWAISNDVCNALRGALADAEGDAIENFRSACRSHIETCRDVLALRASEGFVRRCHGDLHTGNIVVFDGRPVLFDALEFDEALATIDTLYDLAFLIMDLEHRDQRAAANLLLSQYLWLRHEPRDFDGLRALPLFQALRAAIRAMVRAQRAGQRAGPEANTAFDEARRYFDHANRLIHPQPAHLILVGGLSGTGKSTLAAALAPLIGASPGAVHLRSDLERKSLFGANETERLGAEAYRAEVTQQVYERLAAKAARALAAGHSVVADAVFARAHERILLESAAQNCKVPTHGLWLSAPADILLQRVGARTGDASDATPEVVSAQLRYDTGPIAWTRIDASGPPARTLARALDALQISSEPA